MAKGKLGQRTIYAMTIVTILAVAGGYAAAAAFSQTTVTQHSEGYNVTSAVTPDWPTAPTVQYVTMPGTVPSTITCASAGSTSGTSPFTFDVLLNISAGNKGCNAGDFGEQFTFSSAATVAAGSDTFTFAATWGGTVGGSYYTTVTFTLTDATSATPVSVVFDLDFAQYGSVNINSLSAVVSGS